MDHHHVQHVKGTIHNNSRVQSTSGGHDEDEMVMGGGDELRRGPWTVEEDLALISYIAHHGEGRWNSLARCAGLKRTGKSCRLRWLNYLRPDVRRGNITLEEQLLILELHSRWGNRWSKIAQHLPGRTDNEIKNYWRTRVQKHAKQLKCDVNSKQFKDTMRYLWMPRLVERIQAAAAATSGSGSAAAISTSIQNNNSIGCGSGSTSSGQVVELQPTQPTNFGGGSCLITPENSSTGTSSDSFGAQVSPVSDLTTDCCYNNYAVNMIIPQGNNNNMNQDYYQLPAVANYGDQYSSSLTSPTACYFNQGLDFGHMMNEQSNQWILDGTGDVSDTLWNDEDAWFLQHQLNNNNF